jgi:hypothetical protein
MKKTVLTISSVTIIAGMVFTNITTSHSNPTGAPAGVTGSPSDGATCFQSSCHNGAPTAQAGMITSNIPTCGYTPGTTYTITASITGNNKKGFEVSPQTAAGNFAGTLIAGTGSHTLSSGHYITHSNFVGSSTSTATWNFQWTAPVTGTGTVTFYGAFANSKSTTKTSSLAVSECATGLDEKTIASSLSVYPNPATNNLNIDFYNNTSQTVEVTLVSIEGKKSFTIAKGLMNVGNQHYSLENIHSNLDAGIYFLRIINSDANHFQRVVIQ